MEYDDFLKSVFSADLPPEPQNTQRTADDIMAEFLPIIEADKKKGG